MRFMQWERRPCCTVNISLSTSRLQAVYRSAAADSADNAAPFAAASQRLLRDSDTYEVVALQPAWAPPVAAALLDCLG